MKNLIKLSVLALVIVVFPTNTNAAWKTITGSGDVEKESRKIRCKANHPVEVRILLSQL